MIDLLSRAITVNYGHSLLGTYKFVTERLQIYNYNGCVHINMPTAIPQREIARSPFGCNGHVTAVAVCQRKQLYSELLVQ